MRRRCASAAIAYRLPEQVTAVQPGRQSDRTRKVPLAGVIAAGCQCSKIKHVVVPCARTRPFLSVNVPSAVPIRRPQLMTLPSAFTGPDCGVTGRTREILNSSVVCAKPLSSMERMASPMQLSSNVAARPPCTVPAGLRCPAWVVRRQRRGPWKPRRCRSRAFAPCCSAVACHRRAPERIRDRSWRVAGRQRRRRSVCEARLPS
jgi:hypothetical protein